VKFLVQGLEPLGPVNGRKNLRVEKSQEVGQEVIQGLFPGRVEIGAYFLAVGHDLTWPANNNPLQTI
jgi:hypothetical protein